MADGHHDPLDEIIERLLAQQGRGCDLSIIEIELRERGPEKPEITESLAKTKADIDRAVPDAEQLARSEQQEVPVSSMTAAAVPPGELDIDDVTEQAVESLGRELDKMNAEYDADPSAMRPADTAAENASLAAYFAYRAAVISWDRCVRTSASVFHAASGVVEPKDAKDVVKGVFIAVTAGWILYQIGLAAS